MLPWTVIFSTTHYGPDSTTTFASADKSKAWDECYMKLRLRYGVDEAIVMWAIVKGNHEVYLGDEQQADEEDLISP